jgi:alkanesulfonate monooxygenase SsuD/methylene tetrahydromethanopterin reductase-like flavin-dependent oxidoreductase (luciferase family)
VEEELEILGAPYRQRGRQADEALRVFKALWTEDNPAFDGEFFHLRDLGFAPKPVQKPHPPIWVGGDSPGAFRRVATLGDGWHATSKTPGQFAEALGRLRKAADEARRPMESIELSLRFGLTDDLIAQGAPAIVDTLVQYKKLGLTHVLLEFRRDDLGRMLEILELVTREVRPAVDRA